MKRYDAFGNIYQVDMLVRYDCLIVELKEKLEKIKTKVVDVDLLEKKIKNYKKDLSL